MGNLLVSEIFLLPTPGEVYCYVGLNFPCLCCCRNPMKPNNTKRASKQPMPFWKNFHIMEVYFFCACFCMLLLLCQLSMNILFPCYLCEVHKTLIFFFSLQKVILSPSPNYHVSLGVFLIYVSVPPCGW